MPECLVLTIGFDWLLSQSSKVKIVAGDWEGKRQGYSKHSDVTLMYRKQRCFEMDGGTEKQTHVELPKY